MAQRDDAMGGREREIEREGVVECCVMSADSSFSPSSKESEVQPYNHCLRHNFIHQVQRGDLSFVRGLVKFLLALAYLFCLALLGSCLTRFAKNKSPLCI